MDKKKWYSKPLIWFFIIIGFIATVILIILFIVSSSFIVQIPYWIGDYFPLINSHVSAGEILLFAGALLGFFGTIFLGIVAIRQNLLFKNSSQKQLELARRPIIQLTNVQYVNGFFNDKQNKSELIKWNLFKKGKNKYENVSEIRLIFKNTSNQYTQAELNLIGFAVNHEDIEIPGIAIAMNAYSPLILNPLEDDFVSIIINNDEKKFFNGFVNMRFTLTNSFGEQYYELIQFFIEYCDESDKLTFNSMIIKEITKVEEDT